MEREGEPDSPCQAGKKLFVTSTKSQTATLGVTQPSDVWRNNNIPGKDQERSQEQMRNENNSKKAWQEAVERVGQPDQSFGMKGRRTSWLRAGNAALLTHSLFPLARMGMGKGVMDTPNPLGLGVVLARTTDKQCTTNST